MKDADKTAPPAQTAQNQALAEPAEKIAGPSGFQRAMFVVSDAVLGAGVLIVLGAWGGGFLDDKLHTGPWGSLGLSILGGGLGLWRMVKKVAVLDTPGTPPGVKPISFKNEYEGEDGQDEKDNNSDS